MKTVARIDKTTFLMAVTTSELGRLTGSDNALDGDRIGIGDTIEVSHHWDLLKTIRDGFETLRRARNSVESALKEFTDELEDLKNWQTESTPVKGRKS